MESKLMTGLALVDAYNALSSGNATDDEVRRRLAQARADACRNPASFQRSVKAIQAKHDPTITTPDFTDVYSRDVMQDAVDMVHQSGSYDTRTYAGAAIVAGATTITAAAIDNIATGFALRFEGSVLNWSTFEATVSTSNAAIAQAQSQACDRSVTFELGADDLGRWFYLPFGTFDAGSSKNGRPKVGQWVAAGPLVIAIAGIPTGVSTVKARLLTAGTLALDEFCVAYGLEVR